MLNHLMMIRELILLSAARLTTSLCLLEKKAPLRGLEPRTFRLTAERSSQLSHKGKIS